jgi:di/tricarboxylate transporter
MTPDIALTLTILAAAFALFAWNKVRADVVALGVMVVVILTGLVTPEQGITGFSNPATITVAAMMVLAAGLVRTGAIDILSSALARLAGKSESRFLLVLLAITVPASAFINNTPVVIVLLPVVLGFARANNIAASRLLMPVSFGSQLGGTLTLIGTSTNLLVAAIIADMGLPQLGLFSITPAALPLALIGIVYLLTIGRALAPSRTSDAGLLARYDLREYLTGVEVADDAIVAGRTLAEVDFARKYGLQVVAIRRGDTNIRFPSGNSRIEAGDVLIVEGKVADIDRVQESAGLHIAGARPELLENDGSALDLAEIIVPPRSAVVGRTLRDLAFRARYGVAVLALQRHGHSLHEELGAVPLEGGDILLVRGPAQALNELHSRGELALLGSLELPARRSKLMPLAIAIVAAVVLLSAIGITSILVAALAGALIMVLVGCIRPDEVYREMDWMVITLLGGIIPLGIAMQNSGAAALIASGLTSVVGPLGPIGTLAAVYLLASLLTEVISNNATAVVLTPVVVAIGTSLGVSPMPFVVATMLAASNSFMTPIGYQTNTFIYAPGGYRFADYVRVGGPLNVLLLLAALVFIPLAFPF